MFHHNIMRRRHIGKRALPTRFVSKHASPFRAFDVRIDFPSPFNFPYPRFKNSIFPNWKNTKFQSWKRGALWVSWSLDPLLDGPRSCLAHVVKRLKPTYHIKARGRHPSGRILKKARMSSHGLASGRFV